MNALRIVLALSGWTKASVVVTSIFITRFSWKRSIRIFLADIFSSRWIGWDRARYSYRIWFVTGFGRKYSFVSSSKCVGTRSREQRHLSSKNANALWSAKCHLCVEISSSTLFHLFRHKFVGISIFKQENRNNNGTGFIGEIWKDFIRNFNHSNNYLQIVDHTNWFLVFSINSTFIFIFKQIQCLSKLKCDFRTLTTYNFHRSNFEINDQFSIEEFIDWIKFVQQYFRWTIDMDARSWNGVSKSAYTCTNVRKLRNKILELDPSDWQQQVHIASFHVWWQPFPVDELTQHGKGTYYCKNLQLCYWIWL